MGSCFRVHDHWCPSCQLFTLTFNRGVISNRVILSCGVCGHHYVDVDGDELDDVKEIGGYPYQKEVIQKGSFTLCRLKHTDG